MLNVLAVREEAEIQRAEIERLKAEVEALRDEGKVHEASLKESEIQMREMEHLRREVQRLRKEGKKEEATELVRSRSGSATPALRDELDQLQQEQEEMDAVVEQGVSDTAWRPDIEDFRRVSAKLTSVMRARNMSLEWTAEDRQKTLTPAENQLLHVQAEIIEVPENVRRARWNSRPRLVDVAMVPAWNSKKLYKRNRSSCPLKIRKESTRYRLFGRRKGRPRQPTPGYDGEMLYVLENVLFKCIK